MQVTPSGTYPQVSRSAKDPSARASSTAPAAGNTSSTSALNPADTANFAPTGDLAKLLTALRQSPDVRGEAVQGASARVASGELSTPEAATETANAMLQSRKSTGE